MDAAAEHFRRAVRFRRLQREVEKVPHGPSSTKAIFDAIGPRLQPDALIVFDKYFGYPGWQHHEFKAFHEFVAAAGLEYQYLYYARIQCAVKITKNPLATTAKRY